ncbi:MAG: peptidoglycan editing factor PgeF [Clostridia bacterium]|nr:peptidoglycan editing factor PgeF [Clostridia bacterium]MBQ3937761.1 peptidoglycan editing factor PgeF [Clostridia bacterium]
MQNFSEISRSVNRGCRIIESAGVRIAAADDLIAVPGIEHGFSTRIGGISPAPFDSLNMSLTRADAKENVKRNYRIFADAFGIDFGSLVLVNHEHASNVVRVDRRDFGRGLTREALPFCDGIITNDPAVTLVTLHADCSCVYLYDAEHSAIGLAHAGWKGTFKRVGQRMTEKMAEEFGTDPAKLVAAIGPCICKNCFEVDESIGHDFAAEFDYAGISKPGRPGKAYVDIEAALIIQLLDAGIPPQSICSMGLCTFERRDLFFSYRRDGAGTGAMIGFLRMKN